MKKLAILAGVLGFYSQSYAQSFMEENDLWKEDMMLFNTNGMTEQLFNTIIDETYKIYLPIAKQNRDSRLKINKLWSDATVNANMMRSWGTVTINMYGGLARRSEVNPDGFALVLCHELGHAYGGLPYLRASSRISAEGQSDYYGAMACLEKVLPKIPVDWNLVTITPYHEQKCSEVYGSEDLDRYQICLRQMSAGQGLGNLLAYLRKESQPQYETPDPVVVTKTELSYPKTTQCRLDTYFNGTLKYPRPKCWFKN